MVDLFADEVVRGDTADGGVVRADGVDALAGVMFAECLDACSVELRSGCKSFVSVDQWYPGRLPDDR